MQTWSHPTQADPQPLGNLQVKSAKPGILSEELRAALGMGENTPPPWLINMQRYGPPPSYPDLKIPGLNAPIPPGARFGYQAGGWGKPPVDEEGNPLYGDVFGLYEEESEDEQVDRRFSQFSSKAKTTESSLVLCPALLPQFECGGIGEMGGGGGYFPQVKFFTGAPFLR